MSTWCCLLLCSGRKDDHAETKAIIENVEELTESGSPVPCFDDENADVITSSDECLVSN